jgi:hypothetical protein
MRPVVNERTAILGEHSDKILGLTEDSLRQVEAILARAREDVGAVHEAARGIPPPEIKPGGLQKFMLKKLTAEFSPRVEEAQRILDAALNGAVILNSVLKGVEQLPLTEVVQLDTDQLHNLAGELREATGTALKLNAVIQGLQGGKQSSAEVAEQAAQIQEVLARGEGRVGAFTDRVTQVRQRLDQLRGELSGWITAAAVVVTVLAAWLALGNLCLLLRGWSWLRSSS